MKKISKNQIKQITGAAAILLIVVAIAGLYVVNTPKHPTFSYNASAHEGWWNSGNVNLQKVAGNDYRGEEPKEKLPVADLTVHHGEKGQPAPEDNCFIIYSYYNYPLDLVESAYSDYENDKRSQGELTILEPREGTIDTYQGKKIYELRRYEFTIKDQDVLSGYQVGFIELEAGHARVEGVCKTPRDLDMTLPVMQSVSLAKP